MDIQKLISMANQIGDFFASMPDRSEAELGIANHLCKFWEPRMRAQLLQHLDTASHSGLTPLVESAVRAHRENIAAGTEDAAHS